MITSECICYYLPIIFKMQQLRFQNQNIFVMQKSVQFCGKTIVKSKKKVRWVIKHNQDMHVITCAISFYSGKKKVTHNGHTIMDVLDSNQYLDFIVLMGYQRMVFSVGMNIEQAKIERKYNQSDGSFIKFKNMYSQPVNKIYQKIYYS